MAIRKFSEKYENNGVVIKWAGICDDHSIGGWSSFLNCKEDIVFECVPCYKQSYNNKSMIIVYEKSIVGYAIGRESTVIDKNSYAKPYDKQFVLYDFAVECCEASAEFTILLMAHLIKYCNAVGLDYFAVQYQVGKSDKFYKILQNEFGAKLIESENLIVIKLNPIPLTEEEKLFLPQENEIIPRDYIEYLNSLKFKATKRRFYYEYQDKMVICIERKTGEVLFGNEVVNFNKQPIILNDNHALAMVSFIVNLYENNHLKKFDKIYLNKKFESRNKQFFIADICFDNEAVVLFDLKSDKNPEDIINDFNLIYCFYKNKINFLHTYGCYYDWSVNWREENHRTTCLTTKMRNVRAYAELTDSSLKARLNARKRSDDMMSDLNKISIFEIEFTPENGNHKYLRFEFGEGVVTLKDSARVKKFAKCYITDEKIIQEIKKEIKLLHLENWKKQYVGEYDVLGNDAWNLFVETHEGLRFCYGGINAYPQNWWFLLDLIDEYSTILQSDK